MPIERSLAVLLRLDGVVHTSDLAVQSFARHLTEQLPADLVRPMIAGMRGFLEGKPELVPAGTEFGQAEDGYQAVQALAVAAGLTPAQISAARLASRADLAGNAWSVDAADGLDGLLTRIGADALIAVFTDPDDRAAGSVLEAFELDRPVDLIVPTPLPAAIGELLSLTGGPTQPDRILVVGTRWIGELDSAAAAGCATVLVDRFRLGVGTPDWRGAALATLAEQIHAWAAATTSTSSAGSELL